ncbi:hypothetical protein STANM309S_03998 [Streptomyces tanashiensis]
MARDRDGVLWLYYATGDRTAPFASRVRLGGGWNVYDHLFGIGDNNGDGWADLLARDTAGNLLWLYAGTGTSPRRSPPARPSAAAGAPTTRSSPSATTTGTATAS